MNLVVCGEDEEETEEATGANEPLLPTEADGMTRVIGNHRYRQKKSGAWRMVDAFGSFFVQSLKRPDYILSHMWREIQRQSKAAQKRCGRKNEANHQSQRVDTSRRRRIGRR